MTAPTVSLAGGIWPFVGASDAPALDGWAIIADARASAKAVLAEADIDAEALRQSALDDLERELPFGSRTHLALQLFATARNAGALLSMGIRNGDADCVAAGAGQCAYLGALALMLQSEERGVREAAVTGARVRTGAEKGKRARGVQAGQSVLDAYGSRAIEIATGLRGQRPQISRAALAREIRNRAGPQEPKLRLPVSDRAVEDFLKAQGF